MTGWPRVPGKVLTAAAGVFLVARLLSNRASPSFRLDMAGSGGVFDLVVALALLHLTGCLGWLVLGRKLPRARTPMALLSMTLCIGLVALSLPLLLIGAVGLYRPEPMAALVVVATILVLRYDSGWLQLCLDSGRRLRRIGAGRVGTVWLAAQVVGMAGLAIIALAPVVDWDSLMYHLDLPAEFLERGSIHLPEDNPHVAFFSLVQVPYGLAMAAGSHHAVVLFTLAGFIALLLVVTELSRILGGVRSARVASALIWAATSWLLVAVDARIEVWGACLLAAAGAGLAVAWRFGQRDGVTLAGISVLAGAAVGAKLTNAPIAIGILVVAALVFRKRSGNNWGRMLQLGGIAGLVAAPWYVKNMLLLGNPVYPFFGETRPPPWLARLGATSVPGVSLLGAVRRPFSLFDWVLRPGLLTVEGSGRLQGLPVLAAVGWPLGLLWRSPRQRVILTLVALTAVQLVVIVGVSSTTNLRYLQPALLALSVASGVGVGVYIKRRPKVGALLAAALLVSVVGSATWLGTTLAAGSAASVLGRQDPGAWLGAHSVAALIELDDHLLRSDAQLTVLLFEARVAGMHSPVRQDNALTAWRAMTALDLATCPALDGATHLVVSTWHLAYLVSRGAELSEARWDRFGPYSEQCLEWISRVAAYDVYRVR